MKPLYINQKSNSRTIKLDCELWDVDKIMVELNSKVLPESLVLNGFEKIINLGKFIKSNEEIARHNNGNKTFQSYFNRLQIVNEFLK